MSTKILKKLDSDSWEQFQDVLDNPNDAEGDYSLTCCYKVEDFDVYELGIIADFDEIPDTPLKIRGELLEKIHSLTLLLNYDHESVSDVQLIEYAGVAPVLRMMRTNCTTTTIGVTNENVDYFPEVKYMHASRGLNAFPKGIMELNGHNNAVLCNPNINHAPRGDFLFVYNLTGPYGTVFPAELEEKLTIRVI